MLVNLVSMILILLSASAHAAEDCAYASTSVITLKNNSGKSCGVSKLCSATVNCVTKGGVEATSSIVCAADDSGRCPSLQTCKKDDSAVIEKEAVAGYVKSLSDRVKSMIKSDTSDHKVGFYITLNRSPETLESIKFLRIEQDSKMSEEQKRAYEKAMRLLEDNDASQNKNPTNKNGGAP